MNQAREALVMLGIAKTIRCKDHVISYAIIRSSYLPVETQLQNPSITEAVHELSEVHQYYYTTDFDQSMLTRLKKLLTKTEYDLRFVPIKVYLWHL